MQNKWDERYQDEERWFYGEEPNDFLVEQIGKLSPSSRILSIGEGEGRNALYLLENGHQVEAIDLSAIGLGKLRRRAEQRGLADSLTTHVVNLLEFDFGKEQYDAVLAIWCHGEEQMRRHLIREAEKSLKPGGCLILEAYTPAQLNFKTGGPPDAQWLYNAHEIRDWLTLLRCDILQEIERNVYEGVGHRGRSAVVQCLATRPI